ncbi:MAG: hypothetical protein IAG13_06415, partial [Deltaproteobacteria bacterium]|nr:hypothetical protein [Nannocystaceae bacterium]
PDRGLLRARLLAPLQLELAQLRLAADPALAIGELVHERGGNVRLTLRPRR